MACEVVRSNTVDTTYRGTLKPASDYTGSVSFRWTTGGIERMSSWCLNIQRNSFEDVAKAMMRANKEAAVQAFVAALLQDSAAEADAPVD